MQTLASKLDEKGKTHVRTLIELSVGGLSLSRIVNNRQFADRIREVCMNGVDEHGCSCRRKGNT